MRPVTKSICTQLHSVLYIPVVEEFQYSVLLAITVAAMLAALLGLAYCICEECFGSMTPEENQTDLCMK